MKPSKLEKISDRKLFHLIKILSKEIDIDDIDNSINNDFQIAVQSVCKLFNIETEYVDEDYIFNLWGMNEDIFENSTLTSPLKRPKLKIYEIEWEATFTKFSTEKYKLKEPLYSQNMNDVHSILMDMRGNGWLDIFEGELIEDYDTDSEMTGDDILDIKLIN